MARWLMSEAPRTVSVITSWCSTSLIGIRCDRPLVQHSAYSSAAMMAHAGVVQCQVRKPAGARRLPQARSGVVVSLGNPLSRVVGCGW